MQSLYSTLISKCDAVKMKINTFISQHTKIYVVPSSIERVPSNSPIDTFMRRMPHFLPSDAFEDTVATIGFQSWAPLDDEGRMAQCDALNDFREYAGVLTPVIHDYPATTKQDMEESIQTIMDFIQQDGYLPYQTVDAVVQAISTELDKQKQILGSYIKNSVASPILVADTNALYYNPALEDWTFADIPQFQLAVLPPVLEELDRHKSEHRNETLQIKAGRLVNQIKEYRRRGDIQRGVPLKSTISTFITPNIIPIFNRVGPFSDSKVADNQILAGCFELARQNPGCPVALVTRDVNLQNKAACICLPYLEPPDAVPKP